MDTEIREGCRQSPDVLGSRLGEREMSGRRSPGMREWVARSKVERLRQWPTIERLVAEAAAVPEVAGVIVIGSFAAGRADTLSDVDLFVVAREGDFEAAWEKRERLSGSGLLTSWEKRRKDNPDVGLYVWLNQDLVLVEALFCTPGSARLAELAPAVVVIGSPSLLDGFRRRPPVRRSEMRFTNPVERAYHQLKEAIRK